LTDFIPNLERIVLTEDTAAIQIQKENVVRFEARREQNGFTSAEKRLLTEV
jgi:Flp pilus assembly CpaF family ATPase